MIRHRQYVNFCLTLLTVLTVLLAVVLTMKPE